MFVAEMFAIGSIAYAFGLFVVMNRGGDRSVALVPSTRGEALDMTAMASAGRSVLATVMSFNTELFGWRDRLIIQGAASAVIVSLIALIFVRDRFLISRPPRPA